MKEQHNKIKKTLKTKSFDLKRAWSTKQVSGWPGLAQQNQTKKKSFEERMAREDK